MTKHIHSNGLNPKKAAAVFVPLGKYGAGLLLVGKTSFSLGNSVTGNFVQLDGGRQLWEEPSSKWGKSFKSEIVQGTTFAISRMVDGFQIYSFSLKMSDSWVRGRRWGSLMGNPFQSSYCPTTLSVTPRSNWKIAKNSISTWEHQNFNLPSQNSVLHLPHWYVWQEFASLLIPIWILWSKTKGNIANGPRLRNHWHQHQHYITTFGELFSSTFFATDMTPGWRGLQENVWFSVFWFVCLHGFAPSYGCYENNSKIDILDISQRRNCLMRGGRIFFLKSPCSRALYIENIYHETW